MQTWVGLCGHGLDHTDFGWILAMTDVGWYNTSNDKKNNLFNMEFDINS